MSDTNHQDIAQSIAGDDKKTKNLSIHVPKITKSDCKSPYLSEMGFYYFVDHYFHNFFHLAMLVSREFLEEIYFLYLQFSFFLKYLRLISSECEFDHRRSQ